MNTSANKIILFQVILVCFLSFSKQYNIPSLEPTKNIPSAKHGEEQIANDMKKSPQARSLASEMFVVARAKLVRLAEKGPTFKPQLTR